MPSTATLSSKPGLTQTPSGMAAANADDTCARVIKPAARKVARGTHPSFRLWVEIKVPPYFVDSRERMTKCRITPSRGSRKNPLKPNRIPKAPLSARHPILSPAPDPRRHTPGRQTIGWGVGKKKPPGEGRFLIWRLPTLAQPIEALPSAALRLTAEFGMGSGRTAALRPPEKSLYKELRAMRGGFTENYTWRIRVSTGRRAFLNLPVKGKIKPHDLLVSVH